MLVALAVTVVVAVGRRAIRARAAGGEGGDEHADQAGDPPVDPRPGALGCLLARQVSHRRLAYSLKPTQGDWRWAIGPTTGREYYVGRPGE